MFIKLNTIQSKLLAWVQRARDTSGDRESLSETYVDDNVMASDGYRLHAVKVESVLEEWDIVYHGKTIRFGKVKAGENILEPEEMNATFPEIEGILPKGTPEYVTAVNPKFMIEAMRGLDKNEAVRMVFYGTLSPFELHGTIEGEPVYALIMPMDAGHEDISNRNWRPGR